MNNVVKAGLFGEWSNQFENIVNTVRESLVVLDTEMKVIFANDNFYNTFKVKPEVTIGNSIFTVGNQEWNISRLRELKKLLERIIPENTPFNDFEVEHVFPTIGHKVMLLNAREIHSGAECKKIILLAIEDITERKRIEIELKEKNAELERFNKLFVGREMRMIDLKKIVAEMEQEMSALKNPLKN